MQHAFTKNKNSNDQFFSIKKLDWKDHQIGIRLWQENVFFLICPFLAIPKQFNGTIRWPPKFQLFLFISEAHSASPMSSIIQCRAINFPFLLAIFPTVQ